MSWQTYTQPKRPNGITHVTLQDIQEVWNALDERIKTVYDLNSEVIGAPEIVTHSVPVDLRDDPVTENKSVGRLLDIIQEIGGFFVFEDGATWRPYSTSTSANDIITHAALDLGYSSGNLSKIRQNLISQYKDFIVIDELDICRKAIQLMTHVSLTGMTNSDTNVFPQMGSSSNNLERIATDSDYEQAKDSLFNEPWTAAPDGRFLMLRATRSSPSGCGYLVHAMRAEGQFKLDQKWQDLGYSAFWQMDSWLPDPGDLREEDIITDFGSQPSVKFTNNSTGNHVFTFYNEVSSGVAELSGDIELYHEGTLDRSVFDLWPRPTSDGCGSDTVDQAWQNQMQQISERPLFVGVPQYEYGDDLS